VQLLLLAAATDLRAAFRSRLGSPSPAAGSNAASNARTGLRGAQAIPATARLLGNRNRWCCYT